MDVFTSFPRACLLESPESWLSPLQTLTSYSESCYRGLTTSRRSKICSSPQGRKRCKSHEEYTHVWQTEGCLACEHQGRADGLSLSIFSQTPTISPCSEAFLPETPSDSGPLAPEQEGSKSAYLQGDSRIATALLSLSVRTHLGFSTSKSMELKHTLSPYLTSDHEQPCFSPLSLGKTHYCEYISFTTPPFPPTFPL